MIRVSTAASGAQSIRPTGDRSAAGNGPDVNLLLSSAVTAAAAPPTLTAKIRQRINLFGQQLVGTGAYWQHGKAEARRFRLELKVQMGDGLASVEQVCNGAELWIHEDLLDRPTLTRIDLYRVRAALIRHPGVRTVPAYSVSLPIGGLPNLLENLATSFQFARAEEKRLDTLPVYRIEGTWKPAALAEMIPEQRDAILAGGEPNWKKAPAEIPQRVAITLGQEDLFPYRIEYLREQPGKKGAPAILQPLLVVEWFEVQAGAPIDPQRFVYRPGNQRDTDETAAYLKRLGIDEPIAEDARRLEPPASIGVIHP